MTISEIIKTNGGPRRFADLTGIPYRTIQAWARPDKPDGRKPPPWLPKILLAALPELKRDS